VYSQYTEIGRQGGKRAEVSTGLFTPRMPAAASPYIHLTRHPLFTMLQTTFIAHPNTQ
jgi:hypothetical protein